MMASLNDATPFATICLRTVSLAKGSALWTICPPYLIKACAETLGHIASIGVCHASDYGHKLSKYRFITVIGHRFEQFRLF